MLSTRTDPTPSWARFSLVCGLLVAGLGVLVLVGWLVGSVPLTAFAPGRIPMAPSAALLFLLFGGLVALDSTRPDVRPGVTAGAAAAGTAVAGVLLILSLAGVTPGIEHLGLAISGELAGAPVGHMSPVTALAFVVAGGSYLMATRGAGPWWARSAFLAALALEFLAVSLLAAYVLSRPLLYDTGVIPPALSTSLGLVVLAGGLMALAAADIWPARDSATLQPRPILGLLAVIATAAVVIFGPAYFLFNDYRSQARAEVESRLLAVADLKVHQIQEWREERIRDAQAFYANRVFADLVESALYGQDDAAAADLRNWLDPIAATFQYRRIAILDSLGATRLTVPDTDADEGQHSGEDAVRAMHSGEVVLEGFHRDAPDGPVHLTVVAPVLRQGQVLAAVVIRVDPHVYLYPLLQRWPVYSRTAETLLVRRDGDDVLFLNDLRFRDSTALTLRLPLADSDLPAARAILGQEGIVEGTDYRGEPVVAAVQSVPGTDWKLVARVDVAEAFAPLKQEFVWAVARVVVLFLALVLTLAFLWQRREKLHLRKQLSSERGHRTLLNSIGDAVIAADSGGRVQLMNPVAEALTGWSEADATGRPLEEVFHIVAEDTGEPVENPVAEVIRSGGVVGLANSTVLIARDGTERPIADSAAPVTDASGSVTGVVLVFRDQTEQRRARKRLEQAMNRSQLYLDVAGVLILVLDESGRVRVINQRGEEILGYPASEILGRDWFDTFVPDDERSEVRAIFDAVIAGDQEQAIAARTRVMTRQGGERIIDWRNTVVRRDDGQIIRVVASGQDVTEQQQTQEALRRNEARYRNLVNSIRDAILVADTDRKIIGCNQAFTDLFGYEEEEVVGRSTSYVYESDEEYAAMAPELRAHMDDPNFVANINYRRKSGEVFPGETSAFHLTDSDGEVVGFIGLIRDVTDRVAAKEALEESEERYRTLFESAPVGIFHTRSSGGVMSINQTMAQILGFDSPDGALEHYTDLRHQLYVDPERRTRFLEELRDHGWVEHFEYEARRVDGAIIWIEMNARVSREHEDGSFDIEGFALDITDRKRAEQVLRKEQTLLERTERLARIGSWELDVATGQVMWSDELFRIFGRDPEKGPSHLGQDSELFPEEDAERLGVAVRQAIEKGEAYDLELRALRSDGEVRHLRARGFPEHVGDGVTELYGFFEDITAEKQQEARAGELEAQLAQARKMEAVGRLAGGVAHDFNNMLSVILGHVELAQQALQPDHPLQTDLEHVRKAAQNSADLTRQLLAFAREQVATPVVIDLNETVDGMIKMLRRLIGEDIELRWQPGPDPWPVRMDPVQVNQILANLLVNARDAIEGVGTVTIETRTATIDTSYAELHPDAEPGDYVILSVTDTGAGMDEGILERLFDPFFTTKAVGTGTGLGLATVYGIVRQNDGFITVYSEPGHGSNFRVHLPRSSGTTSGREPRASAPARSLEGTETVLVVEDQPAVLQLVEKILTRWGYRVLTATAPVEAMEIAAEHGGGIHLLITDVVMPEMNGRDLADQLQQAYPELAVLFMSGYAEDVIAERGVIEEGVHFLEKPFTSDLLGIRVREAIEDG